MVIILILAVLLPALMSVGQYLAHNRGVASHVQLNPVIMLINLKFQKAFTFKDLVINSPLQLVKMILTGRKGAINPVFFNDFLHNKKLDYKTK